MAGNGDGDDDGMECNFPMGFSGFHTLTLLKRMNFMIRRKEIDLLNEGIQDRSITHPFVEQF